MKAIIFAAGLGTRIQSISKGKPKALVNIKGQPLIEHTIEYLLSYGVNSIIINVHHQADMVEEYIQKCKYSSIITISDERNELLDTGGGLLKAKPFFEDEDLFTAINVDVLTNLDLNTMISYHKKHQAIATLAVRNRETSRYLLFDSNNKMIGWKNITSREQILHQDIETPQAFAFSGVHILSSSIWNYLEQERKSKFSITPSYINISKEAIIMAYQHQNGYWFDVGKPETYKMACEYLDNRIV